MKESLDDQTVLLEYYHTEPVQIGAKRIDTLCMFVITHSQIELIQSPITSEQLVREVAGLFEALGSSFEDPKTFSDKSGELYDSLIQPVHDRIKDKKIVIVPWKFLFYVPYSTLKDSRTGEFFARDTGYTVLPSSSSYRFVMQKRKSNRRKLLAIGNPATAFESLPYAGDEVKRIGIFFPSFNVIWGKLGTETVVKEIEDQPDILHLATHSSFNPDEPMFSMIALAPDKQNDGLLEVHEVMGLNLDRVSLVTLSSCSSGQVRLGAGDDVMSLFTAFLFAGTPSVLASLWPVDDKTTEALMISFYEHYVKEGESKSAALRHAQLEMNEIGVPPNLWAAFTMFGDWF